MLAVEEKIYSCFFSKITGMAVKWLYQDVVTFNSIFQNLHSFEGQEGVTPRKSVKKLLLKISQNSQGNTCVGVSFLRNLLDACEFSEILKSSFFTDYLEATAS